MNHQQQARLKAALGHNEQLQLGGWVTLGHPAIAEIFSNAGFDWVCVDLEHSMIDLNQAAQLIQAIDSNGASPLVRLSSLDDVQIKRILDHGAHGVIVPMVNNRQDVDAIVRAVHYPPIGRRGVGLARAQAYGAGFKDYCAQHTANAIIVVQIEHQEAVSNIDAILGSNEVDAFIVGPYDLSASMGIAGQFDHPKMVQALATIRQAARKHNKCGGIHVVEPETQALDNAVAQGYNFVAYSVDIRMLDVASRLAVGRVKR